MTPQSQVHQDWDARDVWKDIVTIINDPEVRDAWEARKRLNEKYLVDNRLLLTAKQAAEFWQIATTKEAESHPRSIFDHVLRVWEIPITVIPTWPQLPADVGGGKKAVAINDRIYVFTMVDPEEQMSLELRYTNPLRMTGDT